MQIFRQLFSKIIIIFLFLYVVFLSASDDFWHLAVYQSLSKFQLRSGEIYHLAINPDFISAT